MKPPSRTDMLIDLLLQEVPEAELLVDERGQAHARLREGGRELLLRLGSAAFRQFLQRRCFALTGIAPTPAVLSRVVSQLDAQARPLQRGRLWNRVGRGPDGAIFVDLADGRGAAARVSAAGVEEVASPPRLFRRFEHQEALPAPRLCAPRELLRLCAYLNLQGEDDAMLFLCSTVAALVPDIPQPLLMLYGPHGAAKSTAGRLRRRLVDPSQLDVVTVRSDRGELALALDQHYMPLFDNLERLSPLQEEMFCLAVTGGGFTKRTLYTNQEAVVFRFHRPLILTGVGLPSVTPDLLDRALLIELQRIADGQRRTEGALWRAFEEERPRLFGALLAALSVAMRLEPQLALGGLTRMADFSRWGTAAALSLGYGAAAFQAALHRNAQRQAEQVLEDDGVAEALRRLVARRGGFDGSATELLGLLQEQGGPGVGRLPRRAADLGRRLSLLQAPLLQAGITVKQQRDTDRSRQRRWVLSRVAVALEDEEAGGEGALEINSAPSP